MKYPLSIVVGRILNRFSDYFIPANWPPGQLRNQARNLAGLLLGYLLIVPIYIVAFWWQGLQWVSATCIVLFVVVLVLLSAMRRTGALVFVGYSALAVLYVTVVGLMWFTGTGVDNAAAGWLSFVPFAAAFLFGVAHSGVGLAISAVTVSVFIYVGPTGLNWMQPPVLRDTYLMNITHSILLLLGLGMLGLVFVHSQALSAQLQSRAKRQTDLLSQAKSDFLANMSHEIRTPMNAIVGMAYLALQTPLNPKQKHHIERVHKSAENLLGIINDILDFSKIEAGKLMIEKIDFSLAEVMTHVATSVGSKAEEKGLELLYDIGAEVPEQLMGDPLRLGQILLNLGNNAVKFTNQGEILIRITAQNVQAHKVQLLFQVKDTGIGIDAQHMEHLFESFTQADSSTTRQYGGTGLGLAISKKLVELLGGSLVVYSELNRGSTFEFTLPFDIHPAAAKTDPATLALQSKRVLVADDSHSAGLLLKALLQELGMRCFVVGSGQEVMASVQAEHALGDPFDLVLLDWKMPFMDGVTCARQLQQLALEKMPKVVLLSNQRYDHMFNAGDASLSLVKAVAFKPVLRCELKSKMGVALMEQGDSNSSSDNTNTASERQIRAMNQLRGAHVLLVEDNEVNQELARELFEYAGLEVVLANNGQEALDALSMNVHFDGVLMDCQMPVMDGYIATQRIRQNPQWANLPVIAMTANAMNGDKEDALAAGMNDHISKPLDVEKMFVTMAKWIYPAQAKR